VNVLDALRTQRFATGSTSPLKFGVETIDVGGANGTNLRPAKPRQDPLLKETVVLAPRCRREIEFGDWSPLFDEIRECAISDNLVATAYLRQYVVKSLLGEPLVPADRAS
jgi:hypothetical protein